MNVIRPNYRDQFTAQDFDFIVRTLGGTEDRRFLLDLLADTDTRDLILDDEGLARAVLDDPGCVAISPHLYFYVLVRRVFLRVAIADRELADYVAELLADFTHRDSPRRSLPDNVNDDSYLFEMFAALRDADEQASFQIRAHIGNRSLFLTGLWAENLRERSRRRGAPEIGYYEQIGASSFRAASLNRLAGEFEVARVFEALGERFHETRLALNEVTDRHLSMGDLQGTNTRLLN